MGAEQTRAARGADALNPRLEARRAAMLDAAAAVFFESGYERTSVNEIVRRSGGSLTTLYQLFGSKEGLFEAMIQERCARILEPLSAPDLSSRTPRDALCALGCRFLQVLCCPEAQAMVRTVMGEGAKFPAIAEVYFRNGPDAVTAKLAAYLEELKSRGLIRELDCRSAAKGFFMLIHGDLYFRVIAGMRPPPDAAEIAAHVERAVDLFWRGAAE